MGTRLDLSGKLHSISEVHDHVYFQPPEGFKMVYPCIVYELESDHILHADDDIYRRKKRYSVTVIDENPDSVIPDLVGDMFKSRMNNHFISDNLHHFVYSIIY